MCGGVGGCRWEEGRHQGRQLRGGEQHSGPHLHLVSARRCACPPCQNHSRSSAFCSSRRPPTLHLQTQGIRESVSLDHIKTHYFSSHPRLNYYGVIPVGPPKWFEDPQDAEFDRARWVKVGSVGMCAGCGTASMLVGGAAGRGGHRARWVLSGFVGWPATAAQEGGEVWPVGARG